MYPSFNYLGSKTKLLPFIEECIVLYTNKKLKNIESFLDSFTGTGIVSYYMLKNNVNKVISNDIQYYSYITSSNFICNDNIDKSKIYSFIQELNECKEISPKDDYFIYHNYSTERMYFTPENGCRIDYIRQTIETYYKNKYFTKNEYQLLIKILLYAATKVANIASVYGAYLKEYKKSAQNKLLLNTEILDLLLNSKKNIQINYNNDIINLLEKLEKVEVCYLDSPYNQRGYDSNFHLLETIARYDYPQIKGKTGLRYDTSQKSNFCSKVKVANEFDKLFSLIKCKYIFISYSSESLVSKENMIDLMKKYFNNVICYEKQYKRFKSNCNIEQEKMIIEYIFAGTKK